jgi:L-fuconolactonase
MLFALRQPLNLRAHRLVSFLHLANLASRSVLHPDSLPYRRWRLAGPAGTGRVRMMRIDAHHHLWRYNEQEYAWITPEMGALRNDFLLQDLRAELSTANVDGTVAVQARQTVDETEWLLQLADDASPILGVVGWLPLASEDLEGHLARCAANPKLKGLRHVVQAEPAGFLGQPTFNRGLHLLHGFGLVYDLLIVAGQIPEATAFLDRHPKQPFVLDHLAKPRIRAGELASWARDLRELARRPHVCCKVSGMVTESDPARWTEQELRPYFEVALEAFGPDRLMIGTDWPVLGLGCSYGRWWATVEAWVATLGQCEQEAILGGTAMRVYDLAESGRDPVQSMAKRGPRA